MRMPVATRMVVSEYQNRTREAVLGWPSLCRKYATTLESGSSSLMVTSGCSNMGASATFLRRIVTAYV